MVDTRFIAVMAKFQKERNPQGYDWHVANPEFDAYVKEWYGKLTREEIAELLK